MQRLHLILNSDELSLARWVQSPATMRQYDITLLTDKLIYMIRHLNELELEQYFPKCMQWKVRLNSGDGLFIGMRDVDLEMLDADILLGAFHSCLWLLVGVGVILLGGWRFAGR